MTSDVVLNSEEIVFDMRDAEAGVVFTKASEVTGSNLSSIYVTATGGSSGTESIVWNSYQFIKNGSVFSGVGEGKWWPSSDPSYHFYASNSAITFNAAGSTISPTTAVDAVVAYMVSPVYKAKNTLTFEHVFARIGDVTVSAAEGYTISNVSITVTPNTGGTYNIRTGVWSGVSAGSATELFDGAGAKTMVYGTTTSRSTSNDLYLVPGDYTLSATWTATRGDFVKVYTSMPAEVTVLAGKVSSLLLTLSGDAEDIGFRIAMSPWVTNPPRLSVVYPKVWHVGEFTVNAQGDKVGFAPGNLQAHIASGPDANSVFTADAWRFAEHQYDYCNTTLAVGNWHDMFGWVGASASYDSYGLSTITSNNNAIYGTDATDALKTDWGEIPGVVSSLGAGWRTLTDAEHGYLFNSRVTGATVNGTSNARYTEATVNTDGTPVNGLILFPDGYAGGTPSGVTWGTVNAASAWSTKCTVAGWSALEAAGCVFLPAAGYRGGSGMASVSAYGNYWSCSVNSVDNAYYVFFGSGGVDAQSSNRRYYGFSVRLVRPL